MNIKTPKKIDLSNSSKVNEDMIQEYISKNPEVLQLGNLSLIRREKIQPTGGRLDILLGDDDTRYEVEIQLGSTDPSHIIRTIEYWDVERKRNPSYKHCAVIVAEEITNRFLNVISLFNGAIPLCAIKMDAYERGDDIELCFTKVLDTVEPEDQDEEFEPANRKYWEGRSTKEMLENIDFIFNDIKQTNNLNSLELKYNKFYIGIYSNGCVKNFVRFEPKKKYLYIMIKSSSPSESLLKKFESADLDIDYKQYYHQYEIKINSISEYKKNKTLLDEIIKESAKKYDILKD